MKKELLLSLSLLFIACNKQKIQQDSTLNVNNNKEFIVKLGFKISVDDEFKLMLNNIKVDEFQKKNIQIRETVPTSSGFESIVANFGSEVDTKNFIIHLGAKEKQVEFNGIELSYGNKSILITKSNFNNFFTTNEFVALQDDGFVFLTKTISGKHNPALLARKRLLDSLFK